jgi:hypothetical protein
VAKVSQAELAYTESLPGAERGDPNYFENEVIDHLVGIVLELGAHFWVVRDRLALLEEQLAEKGTITLERPRARQTFRSAAGETQGRA